MESTKRWRFLSRLQYDTETPNTSAKVDWNLRGNDTGAPGETVVLNLKKFVFFGAKQFPYASGNRDDTLSSTCAKISLSGNSNTIWPDCKGIRFVSLL